MPLFDIKCVRCENVREVVLTTYKEHNNVLCDFCGCITWWETLAPLTSMQPDKMWSGVNTQHGYFTSQKKLNQFRKENHIEKIDRSVYEEVQKKASRRPQENIERTNKSVSDFINKNVAHDIDLPE